MKTRVKGWITVMLALAVCCSSAALAAPDTGYRDLDRNHWGYAYIEEVTGQGLFLGTSEATFEPEAPMSRAMFLTVLHRFDQAAPANTDDIVGVSYADVPSDTWYTEAVSWGGSLGLLEDMADENFYPDAPITREEMMTLMYRYFNCAGLPMPFIQGHLGGGLSDLSQVSPYTRDAVIAGCWSRIMTGFPDGRYSPKEASTRAQVAAVFSRSMIWREVQQRFVNALDPHASVEEHSLPALPYGGVDSILMTENGYLAAFTGQGRAILYELSTKLVIADVPAEGLYCRHIAAEENGVAFYIVREEDFPQVTAVDCLRISWRGEGDLQQMDAFGLAFGDGFVEEREMGISYLDSKTGQRAVLARFTEAADETMGGPRYLKLCRVIDRHRFVYTAMLDAWSLQTYAYDSRTGQSAPAPFNIFLGDESGRLLGSFGSYGLEGMTVADADRLEAISTISYNDAGPSRAALSSDGQLVLAVYHTGENEKGALLFAARSGQLLKSYDLSFPQGSSITHYGFWQQRPYFVCQGSDGETSLHILPENVAGLSGYNTGT